MMTRLIIAVDDVIDHVMQHKCSALPTNYQANRELATLRDRKILIDGEDTNNKSGISMKFEEEEEEEEEDKE